MIIPLSGSSLALGAAIGGAGTGLLKSAAGLLAEAVADTDYITPATLTSLLAQKAPTASPTFTGTMIAPLIVGGVSASGDITIKGTSHATLGRVYLNGTGAYVDSASRFQVAGLVVGENYGGIAPPPQGAIFAGAVGFGTSSPNAAYSIDVAGGARFGADLAWDNRGFGFVFGGISYIKSDASANILLNVGFTANSPVFIGVNAVAINATAVGNAALQVNTLSASVPCQIWKAFTGQTADLSRYLASDGSTVLARTNKSGYRIFKNTFAPADGDLNASELAIWLDPTPGTTVVKFKMKDSGGTVRTASLPGA